MAILNNEDFPDDLHRKAKTQAALNGTPLKAFTIKAMEEYLRKCKEK